MYFLSWSSGVHLPPYLSVFAIVCCRVFRHNGEQLRWNCPKAPSPSRVSKEESILMDFKLRSYRPLRPYRSIYDQLSESIDFTDENLPYWDIRIARSILIIVSHLVITITRFFFVEIIDNIPIICHNNYGNPSYVENIIDTCNA